MCSANQSLVSSKKSYNLETPPTNPNRVTISTAHSDLSSDEGVKPIKRKYFQNSISLLRTFPNSQDCVFKAVAVMKVSNLAGTVDLLREFPCHQTKVTISSSSPSIRVPGGLTTGTLAPPRQVRRNSTNTEVTRLTRQPENGNKRDRSSKDVSKWCIEGSSTSTAITKFIGKYLNMKLICSPEKLKFPQACVLCLHPYSGNRLTFDATDAMWPALELGLAMSKECGVDSVFQY